ncbi:hypothetical protein ABPG75_006420 [Micractinium tetrahymenae]
MGSRKGSLAGEVTWAQAQLALVALSTPAGEDQLQLLASLLTAFVQQNLDPACSPHLRASAPDRLDSLAALLSRKDIPPAVRLLALQALKILARRQDIRLRCTQHVLGVLSPLLDAAASSGSLGSSLASEAANAASNLAYEAANAAGLVRAGAVPRLLGLLGASAAGDDAHGNAAGALQTLSFSQEGRAALLKAGGAAAVLNSPAEGGRSGSAAAGTGEGRLLQRLVGALHNLSSGAAGTAAIRQEGGVALLSAALRCGQARVAASAAGALQNMSREAAARADIRGQPGAVAALAELLTGPDVQAAVCAAGALANLCEGAEGAQGALASCLAGALAGGAVFHSLGAGLASPAATS